jgi:hypothetical protein
METIIKYYGLEKKIEDRAGEIHRGFIRQWDSTPFCNNNWTEIAEFNDFPYRRVFVNLKDWQIFTYCEGDLSLNVYHKPMEFYKELNSMAEFYCKE